MTTIKEFKWFVPEHGFVVEFDPFNEAPFEDLSRATLRPARCPDDPSWSLRVGINDEVAGNNLPPQQCSPPAFRVPITGLLIAALKEACDASLVNVASSGIPGRFYEPLREHHGLFRALAVVKPTLKGVLGFAGQYGALKARCSLHEWFAEVEAMGQAVSVWRRWRQRDEAALRPHFLWERGYRHESFAAYHSQPDSSRRDNVHVIASESSAGGLWEELKSKDVFVAAQFYLMQMINERVNGNTATALVWNLETRSLNRVFVPENLLGAIWLQFEHAVTGNREERECLGCGDWFEVSRDTARSDKHYCGNSCRSKAYRERRAQARKLWAGGKGMSAKEIAERLEVDEKTVRGWVTRKRKRKEK